MQSGFRCYVVARVRLSKGLRSLTNFPKIDTAQTPCWRSCATRLLVVQNEMPAKLRRLDFRRSNESEYRLWPLLFHQWGFLASRLLEHDDRS